MGTPLKDQDEKDGSATEENGIDLGPAKPVVLVDESNINFEADTVFTPAVGPADADDYQTVTAEIKKTRALLDSEEETTSKEASDGSTASYYELPECACELQHLISHKDMNAQMGEIFRAVYRYGEVEHSAKMRDAKKIKYYILAEIERLEKLEE